MGPAFPGYPGPIMVGNRTGIAPVMPPAVAGLPQAGGGGLPNTTGLPDHLVRFMENARAGRIAPPQGGGGMAFPPDIPGMPKMPGPPPGMLGGALGGGLFQPLPPVRPFDSANQVAAQGGAPQA